MKISTRGEYGLRALIDIALRYKKKPVLLKEIAERQDISMKYLDRIISPLRNAGLIGRKKEGYYLLRAPEEISCLEIISLLEGSLAPVSCVDDPSFCSKVESCAVSELWERMKKAEEEVLNSVTLYDIAERQSEKLHI